jgi:hypothetical protein
MKRLVRGLNRIITPLAAVISCSIGIGLVGGFAPKAIAQPSQNRVWIQPYTPQPQWQYTDSGAMQGTTSQAYVVTAIVNETSSVISYQLNNGGTAFLLPGNAISLTGNNPGSIEYSTSVDGSNGRNVRLFMQPGNRYRFHMFGDTLNLSN